jgi:2-polyprenyl-6-hydroxyphenyl methylase / 3-demethylubiquinone-9 3-methyltransferase
MLGSQHSKVDMTTEQKHYSKDHWLRSLDAERALEAYMEQQSKAYSRVKNAFITELLGDLSGKRFLDYGCGAGMFVVHAARDAALEVVGVDTMETALATARHFARTEGLESLCTFIRSDRFPRLTSSPRFDVILMKDVIEHVPDDQALLEEAAGAMVPGGHLVLSTQNSLSLNYLIQATYHRGLRRDKNWFGWDETHLRFYTPMSLQKMLKEAGFNVLAWRSAYLIPYKFPRPKSFGLRFIRIDALSWLDRALGGIYPYNRLGWNLMVKAERSRLVATRVPVRPMVHANVAPAPSLLTSGSLHDFAFTGKRD